jgi:hypothetical protein
MQKEGRSQKNDKIVVDILNEKDTKIHFLIDVSTYKRKRGGVEKCTFLYDVVCKRRYISKAFESLDKFLMSTF